MESIIKDPWGNEFKSIKDMCDYHKVRYLTFWRRKKQGYSDLEALCPAKYYDHLGQRFSSIKEMAEYHGIEYRLLYRRLQRGWDLKTALTEPKCDSDTAVSDHLGNVFPSLVAMCQAYGININTYLYRIKAGWDKEEALIIPPLFDSAGGAKETLDHLGNVYSSLTEMCKAYGISVGMYRYRRKRGWTIEDSLTKPKDISNIPRRIRDHKGNEFISIGEMCRLYNIHKRTFQKRIESGWDIRMALQEPVHDVGRRMERYKTHDSLPPVKANE